MAEHRASIKHLPALDGLRGAAVLGVVVFHGGVWLKGGYLGVDLFFVLSGFLITSILLAEVEKSGKINLGTFWVRRARRLFPALLSLIPAIALYAWLVAKPDELAGLRGDALATLGYVANWRQVFSDKSYWDLFAAPSPLEHTWSLAIEEQFYVVWPMIVTFFLVVLRLRRRGFLVVTLVLLAVSIALALALYDPQRSYRVYFGTDTRAAAILMGAALACILGPEPIIPDRSVRILDVSGAFAIAALAWAWMKLDGQDARLYHGGFWITELLCLVLIGCAVAGQRSIIGRIFAFRPLAWVGTISYGIYLWHWPIDCVITPERVHVGPYALMAIRFALTFAIAVPSYRFFEAPIRARGIRLRFPVLVTIGAFALAALLMVRATKPRPSLVHAPLMPIAPGDYPGPFSVETSVLPPASVLRPGTLRILVLGDSVSQKLGLALRYRQEEEHTFVAERGVGNCSIMESLTVTRFDPGQHPDRAHGCAAHWVDDVAEIKPDVTFIVLGGGFFATMLVNGKEETTCSSGWSDAYRGRMIQLIDEMGPNAGRVMLMTVPYPMGRWRYDGIVERVDCFNKIIDDVAGAKFVPKIDVRTHLCPTLECNLLSAGEPIRPDGLHPDGVGAEELARWTLTQIRAAAR
ncbi:acyltransferase family protein [soil metagenome]